MPDYRAFADHDKKVTFLTLRKALQIWLANVTDKETSIHFVDKNTATLHFSMTFLRSNTSINQVFIRKIDQFVSAGLVQKMEEDRHVTSRSKWTDNSQKPQPLTMDHLGVCFVVIMICLGLCCVVFMVECVVSTFLRKFHEKLEMLKLFLNLQNEDFFETWLWKHQANCVVFGSIRTTFIALRVN